MFSKKKALFSKIQIYVFRIATEDEVQWRAKYGERATVKSMLWERVDI